MTHAAFNLRRYDRTSSLDRHDFAQRALLGDHFLTVNCPAALLDDDTLQRLSCQPRTGADIQPLTHTRR